MIMLKSVISISDFTSGMLELDCTIELMKCSLVKFKVYSGGCKTLFLNFREVLFLYGVSELIIIPPKRVACFPVHSICDCSVCMVGNVCRLISLGCETCSLCDS